MARPDNIDREDFLSRCQTVIEWFEPLNPYQKAGSILQLEDINYEPNSNKLNPLFCLAISAKRYCLFNKDGNGNPIIRKASAHGLGAYLEPYGEDDPAIGIPGPIVPLNEIGVRRWQYDYWYKLIEATLAGHPNQLALDYHPKLQEPALRRYGATSPKLIAWMKHFNDGKAYHDQTKPFGFMVAPIATSPIDLEPSCTLVDPTKRGAPTKTRRAKPIAPFERDSLKAVETCFDRETGKSVPRDHLKSVAEALRFYHLSPEEKFENGGPWDVGETKRRHVVASEVRLIGKEANKVADVGEADPVSSACTVLSNFAPNNL